MYELTATTLIPRNKTLIRNKGDIERSSIDAALGNVKKLNAVQAVPL